MIYTLQYTTGAFNDVPDRAWKNGDTFTNRAAALAALDRELADRRRRCGPNAWDSHYRIVDESGNVVTKTAAEEMEDWI